MLGKGYRGALSLLPALYAQYSGQEGEKQCKLSRGGYRSTGHGPSPRNEVEPQNAYHSDKIYVYRRVTARGMGADGSGVFLRYKQLDTHSPIRYIFQTGLFFHSSGEVMNKIEENYQRITDDRRSFDIRFWQTQGDRAIFEAVEEMLRDYFLIRGKDAGEFRIQRNIESFRKI
jgi:hypothetical protein